MFAASGFSFPLLSVSGPRQSGKTWNLDGDNAWGRVSVAGGCCDGVWVHVDAGAGLDLAGRGYLAVSCHGGRSVGCRGQLGAAAAAGGNPCPNTRNMEQPVFNHGRPGASYLQPGRGLKKPRFFLHFAKLQFKNTILRCHFWLKHGCSLQTPHVASLLP